MLISFFVIPEMHIIHKTLSDNPDCQTYMLQITARLSNRLEDITKTTLLITIMSMSRLQHTFTFFLSTYDDFTIKKKKILSIKVN